MQTYCFGCHAGGDYRWETYTQETDWIASGLVVAADMAASPLTLRMKFGKTDNPISSEDMPKPKGGALWSAFSQQDYETIRSWILGMDPDLQPPPPEVNESEGNVYRASTDTIRLGGRFFVQSFLREVFGSSIDQVANDNVYTRLSYFGDPCDQKELSQTFYNDAQGNLRGRETKINCEGADILDSRATLTPLSSVLRSGFIAKSCLSAVFEDVSLRFAIENAVGTGGASRWPTGADIHAAYKLFYPGRVTPDEIHSELATVVAGAQTEFPGDMLEGWRYTFLALCGSQEWQQP
jgi:hypothetical protein